MELNWSTVVLEIINFLILVWILKRFFYKPVLNVIARRKAGIEQTLSHAKDLHEDAELLRDQYEHRLRDWERERQQARDELRTEMDMQRVQLMEALQTSLEQARQKAEISDKRRLQDIINKGEAESLINAAKFASRLLEQVASAEVEARLLDLLIDELGRLTTEQLKTLRNSWAEAHNEVQVISAYPLAEPQCQRLQQAINQLAQKTLSFQFAQDSKLLAGLHISINDWELGFNLRDELKGFAELRHES